MSNNKTLHSLLVERAFEIAKKDLRSLYAGPGILAGMKHFNDYWARDSLFASWGALVIGDFKIAESNLNLFLSFQRKDGLIPRRLNRYYLARSKYILPFSVFRRHLKPVYFGRFFQFNIDPNAVLVITAEKYVRATGNIIWLKGNLPSLINCVLWLKKQDKDKDWLVEEGMFSNWMDTIQKFSKGGKTLYSNVLTFGALAALERLCWMAAEAYPKDLAIFKYRLEANIKNTFWNGKYFSDFIKNNKRFDYFATDGNLLAIIFGLAKKEQVFKILDSMHEFFGELHEPPATNYPSYPKKYLTWRNLLLGLPGYQNGYGKWIWLAALDAVCHSVGEEKEKVLQEIGVVSDWISKQGKVFEVYRPDGRPYDGLFWKSEAPFAWNAGMFLWTVKELGFLI